MRLARRNLVLGGALIVLSLGHVFLARGAAPREVVRLFPGLSPTRAKTIVLAAGDASRRIELVQRDGQWTLPAAFDHPARTAPIALLLDRLASLTDLDQVGDQASAQADYGVGEGALVLRVLGEDGRVLAAAVQGREAQGGPGDRARATYVRPLGQDRVVRAARFEPLTLDLLAWLDGHWAVPEPVTVRAMQLSGAELGTEPVEVDSDRAWSGAARELLEYARGLFFEAVIAGEGERPEPALTLTLDLGQETALTLWFAAADGDGSRAAWRSDARWLVRFSGAMIEPFVRRAQALARSKR
jgi:hypothetical protein